MKTPLLITLPALALLLAGCPDQSRPANPPAPPPLTLSERVDRVEEKSKAAAADAKSALAAKLADWRLSAADIKADMERSGRVVRDKTVAAGERAGGALDNARVVAVINGKYVADGDLSSLKINVDASDGVVSLNGTVDSFELAGRAMALALDTEGVTQVIGLLKVEPSSETSAPANDTSDTM